MPSKSKDSINANLPRSALSIKTLSVEAVNELGRRPLQTILFGATTAVSLGLLIVSSLIAESLRQNSADFDSVDDMAKATATLAGLSTSWTTLVGTLLAIVVSAASLTLTSLSRQKDRQAELDLKFRLGVTRADLAKQVLLEHAAIGSCAGFAASITVIGLSAVIALFFGWPSAIASMAFDQMGPPILFGSTFGVLAGLLGGIIPAREGYCLDATIQQYLK